MHEIMKYFLLTENQQQFLNSEHASDPANPAPICVILILMRSSEVQLYMYLHTGCKIQFCLPVSEFNKTLARSQNLQQRAEASAIREFKPNRSTHSIPCKCACAAWVPVRATQRPAPQGWPRGDGDGPLADGRAPGECRAHRAPPERRQRHAARVEPVGRGGPNGGGVALRPPFTPRM